MYIYIYLCKLAWKRDPTAFSSPSLILFCHPWGTDLQRRTLGHWSVNNAIHNTLDLEITILQSFRFLRGEIHHATRCVFKKWDGLEPRTNPTPYQRPNTHWRMPPLPTSCRSRRRPRAGRLIYIDIFIQIFSMISENRTYELVVVSRSNEICFV